jgi:hypothetical protein
MPGDISDVLSYKLEVGPYAGKTLREIPVERLHYLAVSCTDPEVRAFYDRAHAARIKELGNQRPGYRYMNPNDDELWTRIL